MEKVSVVNVVVVLQWTVVTANIAEIRLNLVVQVIRNRSVS